MRKISLQVYDFANGLRIMAHFWLRIEELNRSIPIRAIVDTGSPITLIGTIDITKMRISSLKLKNLEGRNKPVNIGGGQITTKIFEGTKLNFGGNFEINMPVNFPINGNNNPFQPSLLGIDFLLKSNATLYFNASKKEAYLEIADEEKKIIEESLK